MYAKEVESHLCVKYKKWHLPVVEGICTRFTITIIDLNLQIHALFVDLAY